MTLKVLTEAEQDIAEAAQWYQSISHDLAVRFLSEVGDGLALIERHPQRFSAPPNYRGKAEVRRYLLRTFRYMIIYQVRPKSLLVVCVVHTQRHSKHWRKRVRP